MLIRKPGSEGREGEPALILQNHIDMVCEKNAGTVHDFLTDPIVPVIEGDWIRAQGTTLGADNGAGMGIAMAALASAAIPHPPIEAVFTTDEEVGMIGASSFDASLLRGRRLLNLDSGVDAVITVSCAASADVDISMPIEKSPPPEGFASYELAVKGLVGGHSGVDIHKGFANANILMARLLKELGGPDFRLCRIDGGAQRNAIPRECTAVVACAGSVSGTAKEAAARLEAAFRAEFPNDPGLSVTLEPSGPAISVMTSGNLERITGFILGAPNGVLSMSANIDGLVQTSSNLGVVITGESDVKAQIFPRSSSSAEQAETIRKHLALADSLGIGAKASNEKPPWEYRENSPLRDKAVEVFRAVYCTEPVIQAIHAGLECGIFVEKIQDADAIAVGPVILGAHSPDEKMSLSSFNKLCEAVMRLLG